MSSVLFVDVNIPFYAAGRDHPLKAACVALIDIISSRPESFASDAEVLQEILHRSLALRQGEQGRSLVERFAALMAGRIEPVFPEDVVLAADLSRTLSPRLSARDLVHLAVMQRLAITQIVSADADYDVIGNLTRLDPSNLNEWSVELGLL